MNVSRLEPMGLFALAGGLLYSIGVLTFQTTDFHVHFIVLTLIIFVALMTIATFKYLKHRGWSEKVDDCMNLMKIH